jgi:hypothetical protein
VIAGFKEDLMSLVKANSEVNEVVDKACKFIEYKVLTVWHIFQVILLLFLLADKVFQLAKASFKDILLLGVGLLSLYSCLLL